MKRKVRIIEGISPRDEGQEKPILDEFLKMMSVPRDSISVDNRYEKEKLKNDFLYKLFRKGKNRYIHISAHGDGDSLVIGSNKGRIASEDVLKCQHITCQSTVRQKNLSKKSLDKKPLDGSLITLSACGNLLGNFAEALHKRGASAVIRPLNSIYFPESAMFVMLFYFILRSRLADGRRKKVEECIAEYIDTFQTAKIHYLNMGGTGTHRLDYWVNQNGRIAHNHLF